ncbi:hypothetical protein CDL12_13478 [Handroanthus impetiginosus]|uniref:BHLH domain-containing protein n=1 Tax=Handroanthus impetiginosus TaxID=429701 RepID=A0A2G9H8P4_9LAMI|nr:hypothetical protein CDL12_13478 [Handroanthus impetiginosus]
MADHNFLQSFSLSDNDPNIGFINHISGINPSDNMMEFPPDNPFPLESSGLFIHQNNNSAIVPSSNQHMIISNDNDHLNLKRKAKEISASNSSPQGSHNGITRKYSARKGKKVKGNEKKEGKQPREVVHVRAKRGQATDSHSLAERVRREKINEKLRCLQDIVPGCYKTMGMAVMLDEIINYVQSLQNQVEFLSMKLTAASSFYDFNSETAALETIQREKALEALKIENGTNSLPPPHFPPSDLNFGYDPQLPQNR